jgi:hypothetical protein
VFFFPTIEEVEAMHEKINQKSSKIIIFLIRSEDEGVNAVPSTTECFGGTLPDPAARIFFNTPPSLVIFSVTLPEH